MTFSNGHKKAACSFGMGFFADSGSRRSKLTNVIDFDDFHCCCKKIFQFKVDQYGENGEI